MLRVSVVIPTLQKNLDLLNNLVKTLEEDVFVSEIIVIDNSTKGYSFDSKKLRVIVPKENLYVNPSWNLGVKEAKENLVAILNDDIIIPKTFCKVIMLQMREDMGIIGFHRDFIENTHELKPIPEQTESYIGKTKKHCGGFGVAMLFYKTSYYEIPEDMKVFCGDEWLFYQNEKHKARNYWITYQKIYHYDGLSLTDDIKNQYLEHDRELFKKYTRTWKDQLFSIKFLFRGIRITIFGFDFVYHWSKNH